jgi:hypothetical protein
LVAWLGPVRKRVALVLFAVFDFLDFIPTNLLFSG